MSFLAILEVLNFHCSKIGQLSSPKFTKNSKFRGSEIAKNDIFGLFEFTIMWFHTKLECTVVWKEKKPNPKKFILSFYHVVWGLT